jgi:hypothetical protein
MTALTVSPPPAGAPALDAVAVQGPSDRFRDEPSQAHTALPLRAPALKSHTRRVHGASLVPCLRARLLLGSDGPVRQL